MRARAAVTAIAVAQAVAVDGYFLLGGTGTEVWTPGFAQARGCHLPIPSSIAIITPENNHTLLVEMKCTDIHGKEVISRCRKTTVNRQTASNWSRPVIPATIDYIKVIENSVPAGTLRIGILYSGFAKAAGDLDTRLANDIEASGCYLPLSVAPGSTADAFAIYPINIGTAGVYTYLDNNLITDGGFAHGLRVPPVNVAAFASTVPAVDAAAGTFFCFPKATTDPTTPTEFALVLNQKTLVNR